MTVYKPTSRFVSRTNGERRGQALRILAVLLVLVAACGGSSDPADEASEEGPTETAGADDAGDDDTGSPDEVETDADDGPDADAEEDAEDSDAEGSADGAGDDDEADSEGGPMGIDGSNVLIGPSGFRIDLNDCPSSWDDRAGIDDESIALGTSWPFSGTLAAFGLIADGMENYFDHINDSEGGIGGRTLTLTTKDDAYEPARVVSNVGELLGEDGVFSVVTLAGTPGNLAVYDTLNDACVPHMFASTGHPAWGDPNFHPWTTPSFLAYNTEARIWGRYIEAEVEAGNLDGPVDVAALVMNNDFGLAYQTEFEAVAEGSDAIGEVTFEVHDPAAPNVSNELTTLASTDADVAILMTTSVYCTQSFTGVAQAAWEPALKLFSSTCAGIESFFVPAGEAGVGWRYAGHAKDTADPAWGDDEFIQLARTELAEAGLDPDKSQYGNGWFFGWANVEAMKGAEELDGGLSRTNLMLATRSMKTRNPGYFDGVEWILDGTEDAYPTEAAAILEYQLDDGAESGSHMIVSDIISVEGRSGLCHFVDGACRDE